MRVAVDVELFQMMEADDAGAKSSAELAAVMGTHPILLSMLCHCNGNGPGGYGADTDAVRSAAEAYGGNGRDSRIRRW
jgi:hypothetical protein